MGSKRGVQWWYDILPWFWLNVPRGLCDHMHDLYYCDVFLLFTLSVIVISQFDGVYYYRRVSCCYDLDFCVAHISSEVL
jgi:hypothetical protein